MPTELLNAYLGNFLVSLGVRSEESLFFLADEYETVVVILFVLTSQLNIGDHAVVELVLP